MSPITLEEAERRTLEIVRALTAERDALRRDLEQVKCERAVLGNQVRCAISELKDLIPKCDGLWPSGEKALRVAKKTIQILGGKP